MHSAWGCNNMEQVDLSKLGAEEFEKLVRWCQRYFRWKLARLRLAERPGLRDYEFAFETTCNALLEEGVIDGIGDAFGGMDPEIAKLFVAELAYINAAANQLGPQQGADTEPEAEGKAVDVIRTGKDSLDELVVDGLPPTMRVRVRRLLALLSEILSLGKIG